MHWNNENKKTFLIFFMFEPSQITLFYYSFFVLFDKRNKIVFVSKFDSMEIKCFYLSKI